MLPNRALIVCKDLNDAYELLAFLESTGEAWWYEEGNPHMCYESAHAYDNCPEKTLCYSLQDSGEVGYCFASWYHNEDERSNWENQDDPSWNYISVEDFIAKCTGENPNETEISLEGLL